MKPFVLLDWFDFGARVPLHLPLHPHSGVAVLTYLHQGSLCSVCSEGAQYTLTSGAVGWQRSGRGAWEVGPAITSGAVLGYRLWVALPPAFELSEPYQSIVVPLGIPVRGPARSVGRVRWRTKFFANANGHDLPAGEFESRRPLAIRSAGKPRHNVGCSPIFPSTFSQRKIANSCLAPRNKALSTSLRVIF